jgi:putative addiction module component (TIGR02574 family)
METTTTLLQKALSLKPQDKFILIEGLINSLDEPDKEVDTVWIEEASRRLKTHREGKTVGISFDQVFHEEL